MFREQFERVQDDAARIGKEEARRTSVSICS